MRYKILGKTGITVSNICLGMMSFGNTQEWQLELDEARPIVDRALDAGINFFDTANVYSRGRSEEITGELLAEHRDDVVIASKIRFKMGEGVNDKGLNRHHMFRQLEESLERLQTDHIDLYQIHRWDNSTNVDILMRSLNQLIDRGVVDHIGASSMYAWQFATAQFRAEQLGLEQFVTMSNHYNPIYREEEREMIPYSMHNDIALIPWSPLARGFLSGKYSAEDADNLDQSRYRSDPYLKQRYFHPNDFEILKVIEEIAKTEYLTIAQVALSWVLHQPGITSPIIGVSKLVHLNEAIAAVELSLDPDYYKRISETYTSRPVIGHAYQSSDDMVSKNK